MDAAGRHPTGWYKTQRWFLGYYRRVEYNKDILIVSFLNANVELEPLLPSSTLESTSETPAGPQAL